MVLSSQIDASAASPPPTGAVAPAPAGGVPSKERRDIPSQGSLRSAQVRAACPNAAPAAFCAHPRRPVGRWLLTRATPRVVAVRAAALSEAGFRLPQLPFIDPH